MEVEEEEVGEEGEEEGVACVEVEEEVEWVLWAWKVCMGRWAKSEEGWWMQKYAGLGS